MCVHGEPIGDVCLALRLRECGVAPFGEIALPKEHSGVSNNMSDNRGISSLLLLEANLEKIHTQAVVSDCPRIASAPSGSPRGSWLQRVYVPDHTDSVVARTELWSKLAGILRIRPTHSPSPHHCFCPKCDLDYIGHCKRSRHLPVGSRL